MPKAKTSRTLEGSGTLLTVGALKLRASPVLVVPAGSLPKVAMLSDGFA